MKKTWNNWSGLTTCAAIVCVSQGFLLYLAPQQMAASTEGALTGLVLVTNGIFSAGFLGILTGSMDMETDRSEKLGVALACMVLGMVLAVATTMLIITPDAPIMLFLWSIDGLMALAIILTGFKLWTHHRSTRAAD